MSAHASIPESDLLARHLSATAVIHTPCSAIYLTKSHAFKVKKPVNLGYLDFTTPEARLAACRAELRLNEALAPGVYQKLVEIPGPDGGTDWAVQMRRLPEAGMLTTILGRRTLGGEEIDSIVSRLAAFHVACRAGAAVNAHAKPAVIAAEMRANLDQCAPFAGVIADQPAPSGPCCSGALLEFLKRRTADLLKQSSPLLHSRIANGRIREGHGDLHAGNICFDPAASTPDNPFGLVIYDRLEFREDFRCKDVAAEIACLASTCDARGHADLADEITRRYAKATRDPDLPSLSTLYRTYYAAVRAKVHAVRAHQPDTGPAEAQREHEASMAAFALAAGYHIGPALILTCGLPGSGKSFAARTMGMPLRAIIHRSDEIRKRLHGLDPTDRGGPELYSAQATQRTYAALINAVRTSLDAGRTAIADASFAAPASRKPFIDLARARAVPLAIVHCVADESETRRRLESRTAAGADASDADMKIYLLRRADFKPPTQAEAPTVSVTPAVAPRAVVSRCLDALIAGV